MSALFSISLRRVLFITVAILVVFTLLGMSSAPAANAGDAWTPTPTGEVSGQIVGGAPASPGEWPWQVALVSPAAGNDFFNGQFCGGSLIAADWVVTAAHCATQINSTTPSLPSEIDVVAGIYDLNSPTVGYQKRDVAQVIVHPNYDPVLVDSDVALLRLANPVNIGYTGAIRASLIPLVSPAVGSLAGSTSWATGWGRLSSSTGFPTQLYEVQLPVISNTTCNNGSHWQGGITGNMLCAGNTSSGGIGTCQGDSGGPLVVPSGSQYRLAGIVSFGGQTCASAQTLSVFTRVSSFANWINTYVPDRQNIFIGGLLHGKYAATLNQNAKVSFPVDNGPVNVVSTNGVPIVASMRVAYYDGSNWTSHSEMMGLPANQLTTTYLFPWYNNVNVNSQLRFGNVGAASTNVTVTIGGIVRGTYTLGPNQSQRVSYALDQGPVRLQSSGGVPIIASMRVAYTPDGGTTWPSFSEMMGLPIGQVSTSYMFPWYNNVNLNSQLRFANVGGANTTVTVTVGGILQGSYPLGPNQSQRVSYAGLDKGPVKIQSTGGVPIIASMRVGYFDSGLNKWTDFSELMGMPITALSTSYSFPVYNNADLNTQLRFGNVGNAATNVTVTVGGVLKGTWPLLPNASQRVSFPGLNGGPVKITSSGGVPIIASERVAYTPDGGTTWTSFAEMMGLPASQLSTSYFFPWYNNLAINTQIRFGVP